MKKTEHARSKRERLFLLALGSCISFGPEKTTAATSPDVIYGDDDRVEAGKLGDNDKRNVASLSTLALVAADKLRKTSNSKYNYIADSIGSVHNLCSDEPYRDQPALAHCSSFLVAKDVVATAGHCVRRFNSCEFYRFVSGYTVSKTGDVPKEFPADRIYSCKKIVVKKFVPSENLDYALIQLDRPVKRGKPLRLEKSLPTLRTELMIAGYPLGTPLKIADNAFLRKIDGKSQFHINSDSYKINSGSPVLDRRTGRVYGILITGESDFVKDQTEGCFRSKVCRNTDCRGESVMQAHHVLQHLPRGRHDPNHCSHESSQCLSNVYR